MAFFGEGGGWYKKPKLWSGLMGGYLGDRNRSPQPNARFRQNPFPGMDDPNWSVASTFPAADKMPKKKGSMIKDIADALKDLKPGPDASKLTAEEFGGSRTAPLGFSLANMGAYVSDPVATQAAMAKARKEEELQRRRKLMGGGY